MRNISMIYCNEFKRAPLKRIMQLKKKQLSKDNKKKKKKKMMIEVLIPPTTTTIKIIKNFNEVR